MSVITSSLPTLQHSTVNEVKTLPLDLPHRHRLTSENSQAEDVEIADAELPQHTAQHLTASGFYLKNNKQPRDIQELTTFFTFD